MTLPIRWNSAGPFRTALLALALVAASSAPARAQMASPASSALADRIEAVVERSPRDRGHWGIVVHDPRTGEDLYARNADKLFVPASNLKLVVAAAAAHYLDPGFRYVTSLHATGPVVEGVLNGDLVLYGRGDPTISGRYYDDRMTAVWEALADSLASRGVRRVAGSIIADASHFDSVRVHGDWESYDLLWWYAAPVAALGFNDNSIDFRIRPGAIGEPASISWEPETGYFEFVNRTRTVGPDGARTLDLTWIEGTDSVLAYGTLPSDARAWTEYLAVPDPAAYAATVFRETLERRGVVVERDSVPVIWDSARSADVRAGAQTIVEWSSPPLPDLVFPILNSSQNWFAEQMLKTLGRQMEGEGSWSAGLDVERRFLSDVVGIDESAYRLRDASGLSSGNLISPRALSRLLVFMRHQDIAMNALPVTGGETGSLRYRMADLRGRVRAKTGGIRNVDALSGFVTSESGDELVFVVIANGTAFPDPREAVDDVVRAIAAEAP